MQVRKAAIVMIGSLLSKDAYYQTFAGLLLMVVCIALQAACQPYMDDRFNRMETILLWSAICTQLVCLFYLRWESIVAPCLGASPNFIIDASGLTCGQAATMKERSDIVVTVALAAINFSVIGFMVGFIVHTARQSLKQRAHAGQLSKLEARVLNSAANIKVKLTRTNAAKTIATDDKAHELTLRAVDKRRMTRVADFMIPAYAVKRDDDAVQPLPTAQTPATPSHTGTTLIINGGATLALVSPSSPGGGFFAMHSSARSGFPVSPMFSVN